MNVRILKTTVASGGFVRAGSVVELLDAEAKSLILLGKAVAFEAEEAPAPAVGMTEEELNTKVAEAAVETKLKRSRKK